MKSCLSITAILLTLILFLSACKKNETEFILSEFGSTVSFCCEELEYKGDFVMKNKDEMFFTVRSPEIINGCKFAYVNGETTLSFDGVTIKVRAASPVKNLFDSLGFFAETPHTIKGNGRIVLSEASEKGRLEAAVDSDEMKIKEISTEDIVYIFS